MVQFSQAYIPVDACQSLHEERGRIYGVIQVLSRSLGI